MLEGNRTMSVGHNPIKVAHTVSETFTFIMTCSDKLPCLPTCQAIYLHFMHLDFCAVTVDM